MQLLYDRQDRSRGIAYVTYKDVRDAEDAIRDFDGANANGQPIRLQLLPTPSAPAAPGGRRRNPFDYAERPSRSLFERIEGRRSAGQRREGERGGRQRNDADGHVLVQGRPRKTQQELDAEMEDYFGGGDGANDTAAVNGTGNGAGPQLDDDIDMIE